MDVNKIISKFRTLDRPESNAEAMPVLSIDGMLHKLNLSPDGFPRFLVATSPDSMGVNIVREVLSVEYNTPCTVCGEGGVKEEAIFTMITLRSPEHSLQDYFIEIVLMLLEKFPPIPTCHDLAVGMENLISIFSALTMPPRKKIQGLWAELLVIEQSAYPMALINAWHVDPSAKYDFTLGRDKIEVKSTSSEKRLHHFSYEQLNPSPHSRLLVASTIVRESGDGENGYSVYDLYEKICSKLFVAEYRIKLYKVIAETVGQDVVKLKNLHYDYVQAVDSLRFYDANKIPHISKEGVPHHVSEVKFASDLSDIDDIRIQEPKYDISSSPLFKSLFNEY